VYPYSYFWETNHRAMEHHLPYGITSSRSVNDHPTGERTPP